MKPSRKKYPFFFKKNICSVPKSLVFDMRTRIIRAFEEKCSYNARILCDLGHLLRVVSCSSQFNHMATILQCSELNLRTSFKTKTLILLIFSPYFACFFVVFCSYFFIYKMLVFRSYFHKKGALLKNWAHCISVRVALAHKQHQRISSITRISSMLASG